MRAFPPRHRGFTLIELIVTIAILVTLVGIAAPALYENLNAGDLVKCRSNLENLNHLGVKYGQDMTHAHILPTSGMGDDEDTKYIDENDGWWISLTEVDPNAVVPEKAGAKITLTDMYHCPGDKRANVTGNFTAGTKTVSYVSWTDGSADRSNPNGAIRTTAKQNLDALPWLSDGNPVKGKSVNSVATFTKMVMPAVERHKNTIMVLYASGMVKGIEVKEGADTPEAVFKRITKVLDPDGPKTRDRDDDEEESGEEDDDAPAPAADDED